MKRIILLLLTGLLVASIPLTIFFGSDILYAVKLYNKSDFSSVYKWFRYYEPRWSEANISWEKSLPQKNSQLAQSLKKLNRDLAEKDTQAFLVIHNGKIIHEWHRPGRGPNMRHYMAALGKAVTASLLLAISLEDNRIILNDKVSNDIAKWKNDKYKSKVSIGHLASHSSGMERIPLGGSVEAKQGLDNWISEYRNARDKRFSLAINSANILYEPGDHYSYSGVGYYVLGYVLAKRWRESPSVNLSQLLKERIMQPLEIPDSAWRISYGENYQYIIPDLYAIGSGGSYTPRAIARIGQLFLNKGNWDGHQLLSANTIDTITNNGHIGPKRTADDPGPTAALGWWTNANGFMQSIPTDAFIGAGAGHQVLLVVPSLNLVAVRMGSPLNGIRQWEGMYWKVLEEQFLSPLVDAMSKS